MRWYNARKICIVLFLLLCGGIAFADSPFGARAICHIGGPCRYSTLTVNGSSTLGTVSAGEYITVASKSSNHLILDGATSGNWPTIKASGSDPNIGINLSAQGSNGINLAFNSQNFVNVTGQPAGGSPSISAIGVDADTSLIIKGQGAGGVKIGAGGTAISKSVVYSKNFTSTGISPQSCFASSIATGTFTVDATCELGGSAMNSDTNLIEQCFVTSGIVEIRICNPTTTGRSFSGGVTARVFFP